MRNVKIEEVKSIPLHLFKMAKKDNIFNGINYSHQVLEKQIVFLITSDDVPVGICSLKMRSKTAVFKSDYILPEYRNMGFHKDSIKLRIEFLKTKNFSGMCEAKAFVGASDRNYLALNWVKKSECKVSTTVQFVI